MLSPVRKIGVQSRSMTGTMPNGNRYESALERDLMILIQSGSLLMAVTSKHINIVQVLQVMIKKRLV